METTAPQLREPALDAGWSGKVSTPETARVNGMLECVELGGRALLEDLERFGTVLRVAEEASGARTPGRREAEHALRGLLSDDKPQHASFVIFGIDNFRPLNAIHGTAIGDAILASVATTLTSATSGGDVFRVGSDCFGVLLECGGASAAENEVRRILSVVRAAPLDVSGECIHVTVSAGISVLRGAGQTPEDVLLEADVAMVTAKSRGRDRCATYSVPDASALTTTAMWAANLHDALESDSLLLHCQPVRSLRSGDVQWELLVRLPQEGGQLLSPTIFIPVAEQFGLAERLDAWVLDRAVELVAKREAAGGRLNLEINVSGRSMSGGEFCDRVAERLRASGINPASLIFEVNESDTDNNLDEIRHAAVRLRALGCRFALDNFGSRHGSLAHLKRLPLDFVKIDGAFIRHLTEDPVDQQIVRAIVSLAHGLGHEVIAVFVGDDETVTLLKSYGVDFIQGFHVGRPVPSSELL